MKPTELVEKVALGAKEFGDGIMSAKAAFFANLAGDVLKIEMPNTCFHGESLDARPLGQLPFLFYAGCLIGYGKEISQEQIKEAHMLLTMPSSRAVISRCLYGPGGVNNWGVPASYMVEEEDPMMGRKSEGGIGV